MIRFAKTFLARKGTGTFNDVLRAAGLEDDDYEFPPGPLNPDAMELLYDPDFDDLYPDDFQMTAAHKALIPRLRLIEFHGESTGPGVDQENPFGTDHPAEAIRAALGGDALDEEIAGWAIAMRPALAEWFWKVQIPPGTYDLPDGESIELTPDLIALVRNLQWDWPTDDIHPGTIPMPVVDTKRPFGDMSYFALDMHRILGWPKTLNDDGYVELTEEQESMAGALYPQMLPAAQAILIHGNYEG